MALDSILIGNTFPMALVAMEVRIAPSSREALFRAAAGKQIISFWGHPETLQQASAFTGLDLTPVVPRPALVLDHGGWPVLNGVRFRQCWVVTPVQQAGFRPQMKGKAEGSHLFGWRVLRMEWL